MDCSLFSANYQINFGTTPSGNLACVGTPQCVVEDICGWTGQSITAMEATTFRVKIGPSGGLRGYEYITGEVPTCLYVCHGVSAGQSGWGIALFVDAMLAPVLRVRRGVMYTFIVEAGNNITDGANYHPVYITNSIDGGIMLDSPEQRAVSCVAYDYAVVYRPVPDNVDMSGVQPSSAVVFILSQPSFSLLKFLPLQ